MAQTTPDQGDSRHHQHRGLGQRSARATLYHGIDAIRGTTLAVIRIWMCTPLGLSTGFGFQLLVDMIRFFPVSHVIQLGHSGVTQCPALTPEFLRTAHGCQTHPPAETALAEFTESHGPPRSYTHLIVQSEFPGVGHQGTAWVRRHIPPLALTCKNPPFDVIFCWCLVFDRKHQRSNEHRELSLLAYLSQLQSPDPGPIRPLHSLTPYQVLPKAKWRLILSEGALRK